MTEPMEGATGVQGIFVIDLDGSHERQIQPPQGGLFPDWSPDGPRIALSTLRADGTGTIVWGNLKAPPSHYDGTFVPVSRKGGKQVNEGDASA